MAKGTKLLGKKRETREEDEEDLQEFSKTKREKENKEDEESEEHQEVEERESGSEVSEASEQSESESEKESKEVPKNSLFGNQTLKSTPGLFGNLSEEKKDNKLFSFNTTSSTGHFSNSSLFSNNNNTTSSLFSTSSNSLFGSSFKQSGFVNFQNKESDFLASKPDNKEKSEDEAEGEDNNELFKINSPNPYNPQEESKVIEQGPYKKKFLKELENIFVYIKSENKFVSKGKGFLSLEFADIDGKKIGVVVYRYKSSLI